VARGQVGGMARRGEIELAFGVAEGSFSAWYYQHRFPLSPPSYAIVLQRGGEPVTRLAGDLAALHRLDPAEARRLGGEMKSRLARAAHRDAAVAGAIEAALHDFTGSPGRPTSFRRLHRLLEAQHYRIANWRVAAEEINYRRFFNINDLAGLRIEQPELFEATHRLVLDLVERGAVQGLRVDHIDGLFDPAAYCQALREQLGEAVYVTV